MELGKIVLICLAVVGVASMCYLGYTYVAKYNDNKLIAAENSGVVRGLSEFVVAMHTIPNGETRELTDVAKNLSVVCAPIR